MCPSPTGPAAGKKARRSRGATVSKRSGSSAPSGSESPDDMRRNPLLISAGVLLVTVSAVIAVRYFHTYESPAQAVSPPAAEASGDPASADGSDGSDLSADPEQKARFDAATALVAKSNGKISIALRDRNSGA